MNNEILYLEVDEDITSAIDKLTRAEGKGVSVVVPKRSTLLQSVVNLKLLQKAAKDAKKELVLVTSDKTSLNLAGRVGIAVADSPGASAKVPEVAEPEPETPADIVEGEEGEDAVVPEAAAPVAAKDANEALMTKRAVADQEPEPEGVAEKPKKGIRVPNFHALQKRGLLAVGAVVLILGAWAASVLLSSAKVTLFAQGTRVATQFDFSVDPTVSSSDPAKALLVGQQQEIKKDLTGTFTPTGKKDVGTKASGNVTVTNYCYNPGTIAAGTIFTASDGKKFTSTEAKPVANAVPAGGACPSPTTVVVPVEASATGGEYNLAPTSYSVGSYPSAGNNNSVRGQGNQMSGGTTRVITVVTQADIDKAKTELVEKEQEAAKKELESRAGSGKKAIVESFEATTGEVTSNPAIDTEAAQVTLTIKATYSMLVVSTDDFAKMVREQEQKQVGAHNQIYDDGIDSAKVTVGKKEPSGKRLFGFQTDAYSGAKLDTTQVANQLKGKRYGDAADIASKLPGIERAEITIWPSWSSHMPRFTNKIKIEIKVSNIRG